jgi:hypothetical protein
VNPEARKTAIFAGAAALLVLAAFATTPSIKPPEVAADLGQPFYPAFTDPLKAAALEVIEYDDASGGARPFKVALVDGKWAIPSHHNYPADAKDRLARTAALVVGLTKESFQSDRVQDHEALGVVDPLDANAKGTAGRGRRVRLLDAGGAMLADFVFGKETPDGRGRRYVRVPDQKRTYALKVSADISTKFEDWVETDLLQASSGQFRKVTIDRYSFDEAEGTLKNRATSFLTRDDGSAPWKVSEVKEKEEPNTETISTLVNTLDDLRLAGVRPKPNLVRAAKNLDELQKFPREALGALRNELAQRGFFLFKQQDKFLIVSNEGELQGACDDGVVYTLRFGEVLVGSGDEVSAGKDEKKEAKKDEKKGGSENRYLFVSVHFDESLLGAAPAEPKAYVADPAKKPEEQKAAEEASKKERTEWEGKKKDWEKKRDDGKKRAEKLTARFAEWYYVISADAFKKLRVERAALVKPKEEKKDAPKDDDHKDHKHDDKKPEDSKPEEKKADAPKPEDKKPEPPKPPEKK